MCMCVCRGEAFLVLLLKCCCCCSIINYFHITPAEKWKYNMCDVALLAMPGRGLATLVRADVVMTGGDTVTVTEQHPAAAAALPTRPRTCPAQPWPGTSGQRRWNTAALGPIGFRFMQIPRSMMYVLRRIHNAIIVEIRSILWCRCRHVWQVTVGTSRSIRKDDIVLMGGCGYFGGNYKEQHPGAALPAPSLPRPVRRCVVMTWTVNMEVEEIETSQ